MRRLDAIHGVTQFLCVTDKVTQPPNSTKMNQTLKTTRLIRCYTNARCALNQLNGQTNSQLNQSVYSQQIRCITRGRTYVLREMKRRDKSFEIVPHKLRHRKEWLDWNYDCEIYAFNNRLKEKFDEQTLKRAFIMKSYSDQKILQQEKELEALKEIELENNEEFVDSGRELCDRFISLYLRCFLRQIPEQGIW